MKYIEEDAYNIELIKMR